MSARMLRCPSCGRVSPAGPTYCPHCGEAIDPALVAELQWLYGALNDLDTRIARGEGEHAITALRDDYRTATSPFAAAPAAEHPPCLHPRRWRCGLRPPRHLRLRSPPLPSAVPSRARPPPAPTARHGQRGQSFPGRRFSRSRPSPS